MMGASVANRNTLMCCSMQQVIFEVNAANELGWRYTGLPTRGARGLDRTSLFRGLSLRPRLSTCKLNVTPRVELYSGFLNRKVRPFFVATASVGLLRSDKPTVSSSISGTSSG